MHFEQQINVRMNVFGIFIPMLRITPLLEINVVIMLMKETAITANILFPKVG